MDTTAQRFRTGRFIDHMNTNDLKTIRIYSNKSVSICVLNLCPSVVFLPCFFAGAIRTTLK